MTRNDDAPSGKPSRRSKPTLQNEPTYPAGMEHQRSQPTGTGRDKPGPKNPPEAAVVEDDD